MNGGHLETSAEFLSVFLWNKLHISSKLLYVQGTNIFQNCICPVS